MVAYETKESVKHQKQIIYKKEPSKLREERLAYDQSKKASLCQYQNSVLSVKEKGQKKKSFLFMKYLLQR